MKALLCREYGPIERLKVEDVPSPRPGANEVLVEVKASSLSCACAIIARMEQFTVSIHRLSSQYMCLRNRGRYEPRLSMAGAGCA